MGLFFEETAYLNMAVLLRANKSFLGTVLRNNNDFIKPILYVSDIKLLKLV